jgi:hypothetical protein
VNIAARVQNLADAEEIYVSGAPERVSPSNVVTFPEKSA